MICCIYTSFKKNLHIYNGNILCRIRIKNTQNELNMHARLRSFDLPQIIIICCAFSLIPQPQPEACLL